MREYFKFYRNFYEAIETLGEKSQLLLYKSVMKLYFNRAKNVTELEQICSEIETKLKQKRSVFGTFLAIKPLIMKSAKAYLQNSSDPIEDCTENEPTPGGLINNKEINNKEINNKEINNKEIKGKSEGVEDIFISPNIEKVFSLYEKNCPNLCKLSFERRNTETRKRVSEFLFEVKSDFEYIENLCKKANCLKFIADKRIDFKSLINNHIGITNGKYEKPPDEREEAIKRFLENY